MGKSPETIASSQRNLAILEAVVCDGGQSTLTDYASRLGLPVATVHRHVSTLIAEGFLARSGHPGLVPGPRLLRMAPFLDQRQHLIRLAAPVLTRLARRAGCIAQLGTLDNDMVTYRLKRGETADSIFTSEGIQLEAYCSAIGKVLLAALPAEERAAYLDGGPFPALTPRTITDPAALADELDQVRAKGFAIDAEEVATGLRCLAVPLHDAGGQVIAALSLSRQSRLESAADVRLLSALQASAAEIEAASGAAAQFTEPVSPPS